MRLLQSNSMTAKYRLLLEHSQEMIIFFDSRGRITESNERAKQELGYGNEIDRLCVYDVFKKAFLYQDKHLNLDPKYRDNLEEAIAYRKNQTCFPVSLKVTFLNGRKFVGCCYAINISEMKDTIRENRTLKNELKNVDQLSSDLIANVTHELKTPVNGILGFSNNLLNSQLTPSQIDDINVIKRCCNNMNSIINDILDFSKISNDKMVLERRDFNFRDFINQIIEVNSIQINEKGLMLMVDVSDEIPEIVTGDELRLSQILNNLFSNAVKFTPYGHIGLEVTKIGQTNEAIELFFVILDTGIGISPEERDHLFKSYSQGDSSITRRFGGTGLGLSICKKLIEAMGGSIQVNSEKNKGSVFTFSVRLGLPRTSYPGVPSLNQLGYGNIMDEMNRKIEPEKLESDLNVSEIDYINMRLRDSNIKAVTKLYGRDAMKEAIIDMEYVLEKIVICIEMENWSKAEELITGLKKSIPPDHDSISKSIFRLLLAIRKEDRDSSMGVLKEIREGMKKEA